MSRTRLAATIAGAVVALVVLLNLAYGGNDDKLPSTNIEQAIDDNCAEHYDGDVEQQCRIDSRNVYAACREEGHTGPEPSAIAKCRAIARSWTPDLFEP